MPLETLQEPPLSTASGSDAEGGSHGFDWAVSYADLLMVLLTFFVIFFQFNDDSRQKTALASAITVALGKENMVDLRKTPGATATMASFDTLGDLSRKMPAASSARAKASGDLVILLPENLYRPGKFELNDEGRAALLKVLHALGPFSDRVSLTFVGHTDEVPVSAERGGVVDSNMVLSNLRAAKAVEIAMGAGWDPHWLMAKGAAQYARNSRTLSIEITERRK